MDQNLMTAALDSAMLRTCRWQWPDMSGPLTPSVRPLRPPTAAYPDLHQVARFRAESYSATAFGKPQLLKLNLEGGFFSPAAIVELIVPLKEVLRGPNAGSVAAVVVSSDANIRFLIEKLAQTHDIPLFVAESMEDPIANAEPVGPLTDAERTALELIPQMGGAVTSSGFGRALAIEANAAGNRLTSLARKGYIFRLVRSRREGNLFMDPRALPPESLSAGDPSRPAPLEVPDELGAAVEQLAAAQGREPAELLAEAWKEFQVKHRAALGKVHAKSSELMTKGDREGLEELEISHSDRRAAAAMKRFEAD